MTCIPTTTAIQLELGLACVSEPESPISQDEKYYFDMQPWKKMAVEVSKQTDRRDGGGYSAPCLTRGKAWEVPFCDLMRPVGRAIHQCDSTPLFPIVPLWYVCVLALMTGSEPYDSMDLPALFKICTLGRYLGLC